MPGEQLAERVGVAVDVGPQQVLVAATRHARTTTSEISPRKPPSTAGSEVSQMTT